ncbi:MAG: hypothetical protein ACRD3C_20335, partial [Vicinamibacterales bacterium]
MERALLVATLWVLSSPPTFAQALSTLHISITLPDGTGKIAPVARHALLISEEPPAAPPRRILTTLAGTACRFSAGRDPAFSKPFPPELF